LNTTNYKQATNNARMTERAPADTQEAELDMATMSSVSTAVVPPETYWATVAVADEPAAIAGVLNMHCTAVLAGTLTLPLGMTIFRVLAADQVAV